MVLLEINTVAAIPAGIVGLIAAIIEWKLQRFFIPPRDYYTKSAYAIFVLKLGATLTTFFVASYFIYIAITGD